MNSNQNPFSNFFTLNLGSILKLLAFLMFFHLFIFRPISKYFEYAWGIIRINITIISMLILLCYLIIFLLYLIKTKYIIKKNYYIFSASTLLLFIIILQLISFQHLSEYSDIYLKTISNTIIHYSILFIAGIHITELLKNIAVKTIIVISWIIFTSVLVLFSIANPKGFYLVLNSAPIYLMLADTFAILTILIISMLKSNIMKIVLFFITIPILYALYSRASIVIFIFVFGIYLFRKHKKTLLLLIVLITILFSQINIFNILSISKEDRMFRLFYGIKDNSKKQRTVMLTDGLESIKKNWLTGTFLGEVEEHEGIAGHYIHNFLSFYRQFGIIPFIVFCVIVILLYFKVLLIYLFRETDKYFEFLFLYFTFTLMEIIIARSYTSPYIWFAISSSAIYIQNEKNREKNNGN